MGFAHLFYLLLSIFSQYNNCCKIAPRHERGIHQIFPLSSSHSSQFVSYIIPPSYCCVASSYCCALSYSVVHFVCVPHIVKLRPRIVKSFISLRSHLVCYISLQLYSLFALLRSFVHFCGIQRIVFPHCLSLLHIFYYRYYSHYAIDLVSKDEPRPSS